MEGRADVGNCFEPCNAINFDVIKQVFEARDDRYGLFFQFEDNVETIISDIAISPTTLITRIGGLIRVGKELFWVIVFSVSAMKTLTALGRLMFKMN